VITIKSSRAKKLLETPVAYSEQATSQMRVYSRGPFKILVGLEWDGENVKKLSFSGSLQPEERLLVESLAHILRGRSLAVLDQLTLRECEAFLRDRNSEAAIEGLSPELEDVFKNFFLWLRHSTQAGPSELYEFPSGKGPFARLKIVDKIRELKAFLNSEQVSRIYQQVPRPELIDVEDLTVFVQVAYSSEKERELFEELHFLGVTVFREQELNFIPEA
jgi:hypothetical protein